ncbi:mycothiol transferase [Geodermatophilus sp. URMC 62]|uniref:mycothiol transferase n=1 Tax=Geodermatophilus sp. URMC 62 TaxID=3423414 RepID=UPI00406C1FF2
MTGGLRPWEPPFTGTETEHLLGALDRLRTTFRWKADGLDAAGLRARVGASALTLGGLLKHLALVEDLTTTWKLRGTSPGERWEAVARAGDVDRPFTSAADDDPAELYAVWDDAVARSRARLAEAVADGGLDRLVHLTGPDGQPVGLRRLVCDLLEEYGRHTGHADLLREAVDGRVGEDPPEDWRPVSGRYRL